VIRAGGDKDLALHDDSDDVTHPGPEHDNGAYAAALLSLDKKEKGEAQGLVHSKLVQD
jgi:hypothetical protein